MFRHSPSRGHRSKGFKVKDVLQICLLVAVCFWLIYQVKHSHDKKKEFDASDAKISTEIFADSQSGTETIVKLGRKDPNPLVEERSIKDEKHEEAEETEVEEEVKHEEEEPEDRNEEKDDERREGGDKDKEIDELDQEKTEEEAVREEEIGEEEREKEVEGDDEKEDQMENESTTEEEDPEHDSSSTNTHNHEAREEHYKGDDASSAVAHDGQNVSKGTDNSIFENENGNVEADEESNTNRENDFDENDSKFKEGKAEMAGIGTSRIGITTEEKGIETGLPKPEVTSLQNSIVATKSSVQPEVTINNSPDAKMETIGSPLQKNFTQNQGGAIDEGVTTAGEDSGFKIKMRERNSNQDGTSIENHSSSISLTKSETADLKPLASEKTVSSDTQGYGSGSSEQMAETRKSDTANQARENTDPTLNKRVVITDGAGESEKGSGFSSANDDGDSIEHDPIDSFDDLSTRQRVKSAHIDSGTLLKPKDEWGRGEDAAAE